MAEIRMRAFELGDTEAVAAIMSCPGVIRQTLQLPYRSVDERRERLARRSPELHRLVAEVDGRVVGTLSLYLESNPRRRHCGGIGMAVHDEYQNQGVGSALMEAMLDLAERWLGLQRIELTVYVDNVPAIRLYEKFGFAVEGTARRYAFRGGQYADAHTMARLVERTQEPLRNLR